MEDNTIVESSFSATIDATTASDGRPMSINVEILGGSLMVQHDIKEIGQERI